MGGVTARGFPYPTGTDRVADGDNAIQALAASIDAYLDRWTEVWGSCTHPDTGPGVGGTQWFSQCAPLGTNGGVTQSANGITIPKKGWYQVQATAQFNFLNGAAATAYGTLFIGDGSTVWNVGSVVNSGNPAFQQNVQAMGTHLLNAGQLIRWGMSAAGPIACGMYGGATRSVLMARLLNPVA
jgi:hypothetical protein